MVTLTPLLLSSSFSSIPNNISIKTRDHPPRSVPSSSTSTLLKQKQCCCRCFFSGFPTTKPLLVSTKLVALASAGDADTKDSISNLVGEDSAKFDLQDQKISSWAYFTAILAVVMYVLNVAWIDNSTGFGKAFVDAVSGVSDSHEVTMLVLVLIFASVHSGLASFRDTSEKLIGERGYRVLFAGMSLPLAVTTVVYFINHRYDGLQLWQLQNVAGVHQLVWLSNFISFFFLYPSTFNLLEVAAVDKPKLHLWETGIIYIYTTIKGLGHFNYLPLVTFSFQFCPCFLFVLTLPIV